jgi:hypothetical protein
VSSDGGRRMEDEGGGGTCNPIKRFKNLLIIIIVYLSNLLFPAHYV